MAQQPGCRMPPATPALRCKAAVVGIGESDYHLDYKAQRAKSPGYRPPSVESLALVAFERALADAGLSREEIDGLSVSFTFGGPEPGAMAQLLGLKPRYCISNGNIMAGPLPAVCADIAAGKSDTVAMVFAVASRSSARQFGGSTDAQAEGVPSSYYFYHPWGWSSQAAHWALMASYYRSTYGVDEEGLGAVAVQVRRNALADPNAVMQTPMTIDDYLASRFVVRPLRLFDLCLVNDGAVCLIVRRADRAQGMARAPVLVAGWGESKVMHSKMHYMVRDRLRSAMRDARDQALTMAGVALSDIQHLEAYDASTIHLINQLEGLGFAEPGAGVAFCRAGEMAIDGRLPVNTAGGNLSGSYMQGWSQIVEIVRQLRHEAGARQIEGVEVSMFSLAQTDRAHPLLFRRGQP